MPADDTKSSREELIGRIDELKKGRQLLEIVRQTAEKGITQQLARLHGFPAGPKLS